MVTEEQNRLAEELRTHLDAIVDVDIDVEIIREKELGTQNFRNEEELLKAVVDYCRSIRGLRWDELTPNQIQPVQQSAMTVAQALQRLKEFNLNIGRDLDGERASRISQYQEAFFSLKQEATPLIGALSWGAVDIEDIRARLASEIDELRTQTTGFRDEAKQAAEDSRHAVDAIRAASAEAGVQHHAETFHKAAERHETAARRWLWAAIGAGVATAVSVVSIVVFWDVRGDISEADVLQLILAKAVVLAIGLYFTFSAGRVYRANAHLLVVNRHREDSLRTYRAFAEGASDQETKSKVLLEAAHAIFGQVPTGLAPTKEGGNTVEVLDGAANVFRRT